MAYSHKVAVCIIGMDGQIYNDDPSGKCKIPFGEYKIKVINKNNRRIGFDVFLGGEKVTKAGKIILASHQSIELERWLDFESSGEKLKFVPAGSSEAVAAGKTGEFEGELEVRVHLEKELPRKIVEEHHHHHHHDHYYEDYWWKHPYWHPVWYTGGGGSCTFGGVSTTTNASNNIDFTASASPKEVYGSLGESSLKCDSTSQPLLGMTMNKYSEGATVKGSHSGQAFTSAYVNLEEDYISIKMYLLGFKKEEQLEFNFTQAPSGVKISEKVIKFCENCGTELAKPANFCGNCGKKL